MNYVFLMVFKTMFIVLTRHFVIEFHSVEIPSTSRFPFAWDQLGFQLDFLTIWSAEFGGLSASPMEEHLFDLGTIYWSYKTTLVITSIFVINIQRIIWWTQLKSTELHIGLKLIWCLYANTDLVGKMFHSVFFLSLSVMIPFDWTKMTHPFILKG